MVQVLVCFVYIFRTCLPIGEVLQKKYYYDCDTATGVKDVTEAIIDYSDYCQNLLGLSTWPASSLCEDSKVKSYINTVMGEYCEPVCAFGKKNITNGCECDLGYWNTTCDEICPGGYSKPCSGYGNCDQLSGTCQCPVNRRGSEDCLLCSSGWLGENCEIAENNFTATNKSVAQFSGLGHIYNLDGLFFIIRKPAEYNFLTIASNVLVIGKLISCYQNFTCLSFLGIRIDDNQHGYVSTTVQHSIGKDRSLVFFLENTEFSLDTPIYFKGMSVSKAQSDEIRYMINSEIEIIVRLQGRYLNVQINLPNSLVSSTTGLLSGKGSMQSTSKLDHLMYTEVYQMKTCESNSSKQMSSSVPYQELLTMRYVTSNNTFNESSKLNIERFEVTPCDRIIFYPSKSFEAQGVGGYNLNFQFANAFTLVDFQKETGDNLTLEFLIKLQNSSDAGGLIVSITNDDSFLLVSSPLFEIHYNNQVYNTSIELEKGKWNKVVLMYIRSTGNTEIYQFNSTGFIQRRNLKLPANLFNSTGLLSIGNAQPPSNGMPFRIPPSLKGQIDNVILWNIPVEPNIILDIWKIDPIDVRHLLISVWTFDEGDGTTSTDLLREKKISFPNEPWSLPLWEPSDFEYSKYIYPEISQFYFWNQTLMFIGEQLCGRIFNDQSIRLQCSQISDSIKTAYYLSCMQSLSATSDQSAAYNILLLYGENCRVTIDPTSNITDEICREIFEKNIETTNCFKICKNGVMSASGKCVCFNGFFGSTCNDVCPGGSLNSCSNHGICNESGSCNCEWNWDTTNCSSCVNGLNGTDCHVLNIAQLSDPNNRYKAYATGFADFLTFWGEQITLNTISGVFTLFQTASINIQIYQVTCKIDSSCVIAVSFQYNNTSLVIVSSGHESRLPSVYVNKTEIGLYELNTTISEIHLTLISTNEMKLNTSNLELGIFTPGNLLDINIISNTYPCLNGILCPGITYSMKSKQEITNFVLNNFKLTSGTLVETLSSVYKEDIANTVGFSLFFNGTATVSLPIQYSTASLFNYTSFSIGVYFKPLKTGGVIITYSGNSTFSLINTDTLSIQCGDTTIKTTISTSNDVWNQIILTFESITLSPSETTRSTIHIYHFSDNSSVTYQKKTIDCEKLFQEGGVIALGAWVPSVNNIKREVNNFFEGYIDEFTIWKDPVPYEVIIQAQRLDVKLSGFTRNLTALFSFSEGIGVTSFDTILGNNLYLPKYPWQSPTWKSSDLRLKVLSEYQNSFLPVSVRAESLCSNFFDSQKVLQQCSGRSSQVFWWFKQKCQHLATVQQTDAIVTMVSFIKSCELVSMASVEDLYQVVCKLNVTLPEWILRRCNGCQFGQINDSSPGNCICYKGFFGDQCNKMCPNGAVSPCNNHGKCVKNGTCICEGHWTGEACEVCDFPWEGDDCIIMRTGHYLNQTNLVGQISVLGQVITFDGLTFDVKQIGNYIIFEDTSIGIKFHAYFSTCLSTNVNHLCLNMITIQINEDRFFIKTNGFQKSQVTVYSSSGELHVFTSKQENILNLVLESPNVLRVSVREIELTLKITMISQRLLLTVSFSQVMWSINAKTINGLLSSCNTTSAIQLASCSHVSRSDICSAVSHTDSCQDSLSWNALMMYIRKFLSNDTQIEGYVNSEKIVTGSSCMRFNGSGIYVNELVLPENHFTIELSINPEKYEGAFLSYKNIEQHFILYISKRGLMITANNAHLDIGILIDLNQWSQISLAWQEHVSILEVYVTSHLGVTVVKAVALNSKIFLPGGTLTIGTLGNIPSVKNLGTFFGSIDEIRIWSRPHNPTIVVNNWKLLVSPDTPDIFMAWPLNDGHGPVASELKGLQSMLTTDYSHPPSWIVTDLELLPNFELTSTIFTDSVSPPAISTEKCDELFKNAAIRFRVQLPNALTAYYEQCKKIVEESNDDSVAELLLFSISELSHEVSNQTTNPTQSICEAFDKYESYIGFYGTNCSRECDFGTVVVENCTCDSAHYGLECRDACALGPNGVCNAEGLCNLGVCNCHRHWLGNDTNIRMYWENYLGRSYDIVLNASTTCSICSYGMSTSDCSVFVQEASGTVSKVGFIFGSYVTTFDGALYEITNSGIYTVFKTSAFSVQVLFWPCFNDLSCRLVREIAFQEEGNIVNIVLIDNEMRLLHQKYKTLEFPLKTDVGKISVKWIFENYIRITLGSLSVLVSKSTDGLICRFKLSQDYKLATGILGNTDGVWWNDIAPFNDSISSEIVGNWTRTSLSEPLTNIFISHPKRQQNLSSSGYMIRLRHHMINFTDVHTTYNINFFTLSFWIRLENITFKYESAIVVNFGIHEIHISVISGTLSIKWAQTTVISSIKIVEDTWTYLTILRSYTNGLVTIYAMSEGSLQHHQFYSIHIGILYNIQGIYFAPLGLQSSLELEQLRMWNVTKDLENIIEDMKNYLNVNNKDIIVLINFDEGAGNETFLIDRSSLSNRLVAGLISGGNDTDLWQPSDIPIPVLNLRRSLEPSAITTDIIDRCLNAFNHSDIQKSCKNIDSLKDFLLEVCLAESTELDYNGTIAKRIILDNLIFYCQGVFNVDECELKDYFDFCSNTEKDSEFPVWVIIFIGVFVFCLTVIVLICCCCCWYHGWCCYRKRKRWGLRSSHDTLVSDEEEETVFGHYNPSFDIDIATLEKTKQDLRKVFDQHFEERDLESPHPRPSSVSGIPLNFSSFGNDDNDNKHGGMPPVDTFIKPSSSLQHDANEEDTRRPIHSPISTVNPMFDVPEHDEEDRSIWGPITNEVFFGQDEDPAPWKKDLSKEGKHSKSFGKNKGDQSKETKDLKIPVKHKRGKPDEVNITCFRESELSDERFVPPSSFLISSTHSSGPKDKNDLSKGKHAEPSQHTTPGHQYLKKKKDDEDKRKEKKQVHLRASPERPGSSTSVSSVKYNPFIQPGQGGHEDDEGMRNLSPFQPMSDEDDLDDTAPRKSSNSRDKTTTDGRMTQRTGGSTAGESDTDEEALPIVDVSDKKHQKP